MKGGRKRLSTAEKLTRGTFQPSRAVVSGMGAAPPVDGLPTEPDWLTPAGQEAWLDNLPRVAATGMAGEVDSHAFGNFCNLVGALAEVWKADQVPPITAVAEVRRMAELFGLAGPASRPGGR